MGMNILILMFCKIKESKITSGHNFTLVKEQSRFGVIKYSFSQKTIIVWNKLSNDCVYASIVQEQNRYIYLIKAGYT